MSEQTLNQPTVHLVDDDPPVRQAIRLLLKSASYRVLTYSSADNFLANFDPNTPGCVVTDMRMPGTGGLELQAKLREMQCDIPVILITGHGDVPAAVRAMKQGAVDFIEKPFNQQSLLEAINKALNLDASSREKFLQREDVLAKIDQLSEREREVMNLVIEGHPNKNIASHLSLSIKTVEYHRSRVMNKMQVVSVAELVKTVLSSQG